MPLVKAQCTNCGGNLEVDDTKDAAICPFCNTPYVVEQAINKFNVSNSSINVQSANINVNGHLDADTMFENWLITKDERLKKDFMYYYATDPRKEYFTLWLDNGLLDPNADLDKAKEIIERCLVGERFASYRQEALKLIETKKRTRKNDSTILVIVFTTLILVSLIALLASHIF